ncbi:MAG: hypothetical protein JXR87_06950 [Candidatus Marinimicrobia bacterium]|nr:hypothetical protein [Candidatus Neomarinimicrobiota bacterium]
MTRSKSIFIIFGLVIVLIWSFSCNNGSPTNSQKSPLKYTSKALMKAATSTSTSSGLSDIPVIGGTVNIQTALINIADLVIEENSGENDEQIDEEDDQDDNDQEGDFQDGDQDEDQDDGDNEDIDNEDDQDGDFEYGEQDSTDDEDESDIDDIIAAGPFALDISSGQALIGTFDVYAGTFKQINFAYKPIDGKSVVISGEFTADAGLPVAFSLESAFAEEVQMLLSNGGIIVASDTTVELTVVFDLATWLADVDFNGAQITDGQILINGSSNPELLSAFEAKLAQYVEVEDGEEDD